MKQLPTGSGCQEQQERESSTTHSVPSTYYSPHTSTIPVAVAVPRPSSTPLRRKTVHQFSFRTLVGDEIVRLSDYAGKVLLVLNVASHCSNTPKVYTQLNELVARHPNVVVIGCPCNQFGHQENLVGEEIYKSLAFIRPGNGFKPNFTLTEKVEVNGANAHPLFNYLKLSLPFPADRTLVEEMSSPSGVFSHPMRLIWMPVTRADISWNFEKFLIGPDGIPYKRYSPRMDPIQLSAEIDALSKMDVTVAQKEL